jgi:quinol-cytochrome oxidoreductase complex cytochrome b subunit
MKGNEERERDYLRTSNFMHYYPLHHLFFGYCFFFPLFFFFFFLLPTVQTPESSSSLLQVCSRPLRLLLLLLHAVERFDSQSFKKHL